MSDSLNRTFLNEKSSSSIIDESLKSDSSISSKNLSQKFKLSFESSADISSSLKRKCEDDYESFQGRQKKSNLDSFCVSPWEFRRLKADLMESQAQRIKLEDRIDQLHKKNKEAVIFFDKEKNEMRSQLECNRNTIKDLEYRINKIRKREAEWREELSEKVKLFEAAKHKLNEKILKLEAEKNELNSKVEKYETSSEENASTLNDEIKTLKEGNERLKLDVAEKTELCSSLEERVSVLAETCKKFEEIQTQLQLAQLRVKVFAALKSEAKYIIHLVITPRRRRNIGRQLHQLLSSSVLMMTTASVVVKKSTNVRSSTLCYNQELEKEKMDFEEARNVTIALSEKVLRLPELEKELNEKKAQVANLKKFLHNNVLLEEMVTDLKTKLAAVEEREKEIPALKARTTYLEQELEKWVSISTDFSSGCTRDSLRDYIESLQKKELTTSLEMNSLNAAVRSSEKTLSNINHELESVKMHNGKLEAALQKLKMEVQVLRKKSMLISRERDSYRQQLDLYEKDLTVTGLSSETISNEILSQMKTRIQNLEISLTDYRKHVEALEAQLKEYKSEEGSEENIKTICQLRQEVKMLEDENKRLSKMKDELERKLESKVLKGEYVTSDTKILHFRDNPVAEIEKKQSEDIKTLKEECDKLRARVKLLESGEVLNITQKVSEDIKNYSSQKLSELEKELQSANLKMQRLKEVFKKTSQEFRDVSYMLLGYRIDLASNNKLYKLYNMYSSSPADYLMFQQSKTGAMEMLGTSFAESLSKLVDEYLHKGNSIPAFLSAVTLELYGSSIQSDVESDDKEDNALEEDSMEPIQLD